MYAKIAQLLTVSVLLWIISVQNFAFVVNGDQALVEKLCKATEDYNSCKACLYADPTSSTASDTGLVLIAINCATRSMNNLIVDTLYCEKSATDQKMKETFDSCYQEFKQASDAVATVRDKVNSRDFKTAVDYISGVILLRVNKCELNVIATGTPMPPSMSRDLVTLKRDWNKIVNDMLEALS